MRNIFSIGILTFLFLISFSFESVAQTSTASSSEHTKSITVKVKGVGCSKDIKSIADSVKELTGVATCEVGKKGATTTYNISYDPSMVTRNQIEDAIEDTPGCKNPNDRPYKVKN